MPGAGSSSASCLSLPASVKKEGVWEHRQLDEEARPRSDGGRENDKLKISDRHPSDEEAERPFPGCWSIPPGIDILLVMISTLIPEAVDRSYSCRTRARFLLSEVSLLVASQRLCAPPGSGDPSPNREADPACFIGRNGDAGVEAVGEKPPDLLGAPFVDALLAHHRIEERHVKRHDRDHRRARSPRALFTETYALRVLESTCAVFSRSSFAFPIVPSR